MELRIPSVMHWKRQESKIAQMAQSNTTAQSRKAFAAQWQLSSHTSMVQKNPEEKETEKEKRKMQTEDRACTETGIRKKPEAFVQALKQLVAKHGELQHESLMDTQGNGTEEHAKQTTPWTHNTKATDGQDQKKKAGRMSNGE